mmetsp:Transcript_589/g.1040  ORF Transcript_589/g.1040 Transcript_589/m.1040 type:complete len:205 (-) Transcript_589:282-896(-)
MFAAFSSRQPVGESVPVPGWTFAGPRRAPPSRPKRRRGRIWGEGGWGDVCKVGGGCARGAGGAGGGGGHGAAASASAGDRQRSATRGVHPGGRRAPVKAGLSQGGGCHDGMQGIGRRHHLQRGDEAVGVSICILQLGGAGVAGGTGSTTRCGQRYGGGGGCVHGCRRRRQPGHRDGDQGTIHLDCELATRAWWMRHSMKCIAVY